MPIQSYLDPIINMYNKDAEGRPITILIQNEQHEAVNGKIVLNQVPDRLPKVIINGMTEILYDKVITSSTLFKVDYDMGIIYLHPDLNGNLITIASYYGVKVYYFPASRVWTVLSGNGGVTETFQDIIDSVEVIKAAYENATNANTSIEVTNARNTFPTLGGRLDALNDIVGTSQIVTLNVNKTILKVEHKNSSNVVVRLDEFTYATNLITETRKLNGVLEVTFIYHTDTFNTEII